MGDTTLVEKLVKARRGGRQEGRQEVVEFFSSMGFAQIDSGYVQERLKAKKKEWGIK